MRKVVTLIILVFFIFNSCKKDESDYRDIYYGEYDLNIKYLSYVMGSGSSGYEKNVTGTINKFKGYDGVSCSNYVDVGHKIGIQFDEDFSFDSYTPSSFNDICCYTHGYIHPTISEDGILSYPEFGYTGHLNGEILSDSIYISYGLSSQGGSWSFKIIGKKK
jgi:hypothetical protein